jgi:hypothetical protein
VFLEVEAEPASGDAAVAVRLFPRDQGRQLERLRDRSPDRSPRRSPRRGRGCCAPALCERSSEGGPCEVDVPHLRGRDGFLSVRPNAGHVSLGDRLPRVGHCGARPWQRRKTQRSAWFFAVASAFSNDALLARVVAAALWTPGPTAQIACAVIEAAIPVSLIPMTP